MSEIIVETHLCNVCHNPVNQKTEPAGKIYMRTMVLHHDGTAKVANVIVCSDCWKMDNGSKTPVRMLWEPKQR